MQLNRRQLMIGAAVSAVAATVPVSAAVATPAPPLLGWAVGQEDKLNWKLIFAESRTEAIREWATLEYGSECCEDCGRNFVTGAIDPEHDDEDCTCRCFELHVNREKHLDKYAGAEKVPESAKYAAGWVMECDRCGYGHDSAFPAYDHGRMLDDDTYVCDECITLDEWKAIDPEYHAELIEDAAAEAAEA
jgi:hypothetical protein